MTPKPGIPLNEPQTECDIDGSETLRDWVMRLADERVSAIIEPHELRHAKHRRDELRAALAIEREARGIPLNEPDDEARFVSGTVTGDWNDEGRTGLPPTEAGRRLLADMETYRSFSTHGRAEGVNLLDPWEAIRRRLVGPEGILAIEREARGIPLIDVELLARLASLMVEQPFTASEEWGEWPSLWERLASIHGRPGDSSRREAAAMLRHLIRLASEPAT